MQHENIIKLNHTTLIVQHAKYKYNKTESCNMQQANIINQIIKNAPCKYDKTKSCNIHIF